MNYYEITFNTVFRALHRQWKVFLGFILAFFAIGLVSGAIWADDLAASPKGGTVQHLESLDLSTISVDADYYVSVGNRIAEVCTRAENCLLLINDASISEDQRVQLSAVKTCLDAWKEKMIPMWQELSSGNAYVPKGTIEEAIDLCEMRLQRAKDHVLFAQEYDVENVSAYEQSVAIYTRRLEQLMKSPERVHQQSEAMDVQLKEICRELNDVLEGLVLVVTEIAETNNLDLFICYDEREDGYYVGLETSLLEETEEIEKKLEWRPKYNPLIILHNHGYRSARDAFLTLTMFCVLVGICAGGFFAVCCESREEHTRRVIEQR